MRKINYYDRIHKQYIELEVTDEVAKFLFANDKWLRRQQNKYNYSTISLDEPVYSNDEDEITLAETIADVPQESQLLIDEKKQRLYNIVWKIVSKLTPKQQELVDDLFVKDKQQDVIAKEYGVSESAISQQVQTLYLHLKYYFYTDKEFMQTYIYQRNKLSFQTDLMKVTKDFVCSGQLRFNLNDIYDLTKSNTQMLKKFSELGIEIDDKELELFKQMQSVVKGFFNELNLDFTKQNFLEIPNNLDFLIKK